MNAREQATSIRALRAAWKEQRKRLIRSCFGPDRVTGASFERTLERELREIRHRLEPDFRSQGLLAIAKPKVSGGERIICVPTVADRLIQFSLLTQLRPRLARMGVDNAVSFGIAPGAARSVIAARKFACRERQNRPWVYKTDIHRFFDNIDRRFLKEAIDRRVRQSSLTSILHAYVDAEITDGFDPDWARRVTQAGIQKGRGVRQGMPLSPFFAGAYLVEFDRALARTKVPVARYVDDLVAFFATQQECEAFHRVVASALGDLGLAIGEIGEDGSKTCLYPPDAPAEFLGLEITAPAGGRCRLLVPDTVLEKVQARFEEASSPGALLERKVHLTSMERYFTSLVSGYSNAYREAQNHDALRATLETLARGAQEAVLLDLFGNRLEQLTTSELAFVGVAQQLLQPSEPVRARRPSSRPMWSRAVAFSDETP